MFYVGLTCDALGYDGNGTAISHQVDVRVSKTSDALLLYRRKFRTVVAQVFLFLRRMQRRLLQLADLLVAYTARQLTFLFRSVCNAVYFLGTVFPSGVFLCLPAFVYEPFRLHNNKPCKCSNTRRAYFCANKNLLKFFQQRICDRFSWPYPFCNGMDFTSLKGRGQVCSK